MGTLLVYLTSKSLQTVLKATFYVSIKSYLIIVFIPPRKGLFTFCYFLFLVYHYNFIYIEVKFCFHLL